MTASSHTGSEMSQVLGRLRFERQKHLGDFIRPHGVPKDAWRRKMAEARAEAEATHCDGAGRGWTKP